MSPSFPSDALKTRFCRLAVVAAFALGATFSRAAESDTRPFVLGLTPMNFDDTPAGTDRMKRSLGEHADVVALYFDYGVPWPEAFEGKPFHPNVQREIAAARQRIGPQHKVFLALNIGAFNRRDMAPYWGAEQGMPRPDRWAEKTPDDPEVITAFGNYCERMIGAFRPDYLCYAIEINMMAGANPKTFEQLLTLAAKVYPRLKQAHPKMLIFPTLQRDFHYGPDDGTVKALRQLLPFSDAVAISTYPHLRGFTAATLPADWFSSLRNVAPDKPFVVAETGFPAERFEGKWFNQPVTVAATPEMQRAYVRRLLTEAQRLDARLVTWFFPEDINAYLRRQIALVDDPARKAEADALLAGQDVEALRGLAASCMNIGLSDEQYRPRPAIDEWDSWRRLPLKTEE